MIEEICSLDFYEGTPYNFPSPNKTEKTVELVQNRLQQ